jgi:hypothetical protein
MLQIIKRILSLYICSLLINDTSQLRWSRGLRRRSAVAHFLGLRGRIPSGASVFAFVNVVCCATGRFLV